MCLCGTDVQYSYFVSPDRFQYHLQLSTDSKFCMQLGTPISMPTTRTPFIGRLYFIYQPIGQITSFQMMPPLRNFDDLDGKERGQKKTDDLRAMTTLGSRTLSECDTVCVKIGIPILSQIPLTKPPHQTFPKSPIWSGKLELIRISLASYMRDRQQCIPRSDAAELGF